MARITVYKNSALATIVSFLGYFCIALGAVGLVSGEILMGILFMAIGVGVSLFAGWISSHKAFRTWWKQVEQKGLIPEIQKSAETAVAIYRKNPEKRTLEKIRALNPAAAAYIEGGCKGPVPQMMVQKPVQQPVQKPVYQPPVQQTVQQTAPRPVQQPVQQTAPKHVQKPPVQQQTNQAAAYTLPTVQQQENEIMEQLRRDKNAKDKAQTEQAYFTAVCRLCVLCKSSQGEAELAKRTLRLGNEYLHLSCEYLYENYRMRHMAALELVAVERNYRLPAQTRSFYVVHSAVHAGLTADDTGKRQSLEDALEMLDVAAGYDMEPNRDVDRHYKNVSIPTIRCWLKYCLAKSCLSTAPVEKERARKLLQEAQSSLPMDPVRMCDMNPHLDWNQEVKLTGEMIRSLLQSADPQPTYQQPVQQQTYQPPVYQQPVQQQTQSIYPPPVYQTPAAAQTSGPQAVYQQFSNDYNSIDEYVDDVQRVYNANTQKDPEVYWQCAKRLELMMSTFPENERLLKLMARCVNEYSAYFKPQTFADRRRICYALKQVLELRPQSFSWNLDSQKFNMIYHVVHASIQAVNADDVAAMEDVWKWLHTASQNRMVNMDDRDRQYQEVALPSAWLFTGYWLARAYLAQGPENKQKAGAVLEEALQACAFALVRQCDLNPGRNTDLQKVISREEVLELWRSTMA